MTFDEIISLRAKHAALSVEQARIEICDFVNDPTFNKLDSTPRIILAAGTFNNQELTSCVLWLRNNFNVDIRCVEITPYRLDDGRLVLVPRVLIPLPEAEQYIVKTETKAAKQILSPAQAGYHERNASILRFFRKLMPERAPSHPWDRAYMQVTTRYALVPACVSDETIRALSQNLDCREHGIRNLLAYGTVRDFASSDECRNSVAAVLGTECFAVRGIFFNKNPKANWKVSWHQDCVIALRERVEIEDWGPWSLKAGVTHVRPARRVLERMLAIRIHLDDCGETNGPLRIIPGSHLCGFLSERQIQQWPKQDAVPCLVRRGDALLMRPLLLHGSSPSLHPTNSRIVHLEFAAEDLPQGAQWRNRVAPQKVQLS